LLCLSNTAILYWTCQNFHEFPTLMCVQEINYKCMITVTCSGLLLDFHCIIKVYMHRFHLIYFQNNTALFAGKNVVKSKYICCIVILDCNMWSVVCKREYGTGCILKMYIMLRTIPFKTEGAVGLGFTPCIHQINTLNYYMWIL